MPLFGKKRSDQQTSDPYYGAPAPDPFGQQQPPPQDPSPGPPQGYDQQASDPYAGYGQQPDPSGLASGMPTPMDYGQPNMNAQDAVSTEDIKDRVEEIAEAIIDEKWNELVRDINKVIEWKERTDTELRRVVQEMENLRERFESLHKGVLGKISEYDTNLSDVGSEVKAMQMAFQKILPTFTENVNKLERLVKRK